MTALSITASPKFFLVEGTYLDTWAFWFTVFGIGGFLFHPGLFVPAALFLAAIVFGEEPRG